MGYGFTQLCVTRGTRSERSQDDSTDNNIFIKNSIQKADWSVHAPALTRRLGFSDVNTTVPDVDDTTAVLRVLARSRENEKVNNAWQKGIDWVKGLQNNDGGWGAFEKV